MRGFNSQYKGHDFIFVRNDVIERFGIIKPPAEVVGAFYRCLECNIDIYFEYISGKYILRKAFGTKKKVLTCSEHVIKNIIE